MPEVLEANAEGRIWPGSSAGVQGCLWSACTLVALFAVYHRKQPETTGFAVDLLSTCSHPRDVNVLLTSLVLLSLL